MPALQTVARYKLTPALSLLIARGSVLDFGAGTVGTATAGPPEAPLLAGIVNAANTGCLGGGGVDGAITNAGGFNLARDRMALPLIDPSTSSVASEKDNDNIKAGKKRFSPEQKSDGDDSNKKQAVEPVENENGGSQAEQKPISDDANAKQAAEPVENDDGSSQSSRGSSFSNSGVRCPEGGAVVTGPGDYGTLRVPYVIHAVGPNYWEHGSSLEADLLLKSAYQSALDRAAEVKLQQVAFSLLSAGVFRGSQPLSHILQTAVQGILEWTEAKSKDPSDETLIEVDTDAADKGTTTLAVGKAPVVSLRDIVLCGFSAKECMALKKVCDEVLLSARNGSHENSGRDNSDNGKKSPDEP